MTCLERHESRTAAGVKSSARYYQLRLAVAACVLSAIAAGCSSPEPIRDEYAVRGGTAGSNVNGIGVLADMFGAYGFDVYSWRRLTPKLNGSRVIVWAPNDFAGPDPEHMEFLDAWLRQDTGRTLIYIGRDYDAVSNYWQQIQALADQSQQQEIARRLGLAQSRHDQERVLMPEQEVGEWFVIRRDHPRRRISELSGPWNGTIDDAETDIWVQGRLEIPTKDELNSLSKDGQGGQYTYTPLLQGDSIDLAYRIHNSQWGANQVIVVVNGSFLLNLPLVNVQHRRLAGHLIDECRASSRAQQHKVAFIESGPGGPPISAADAEVGDPEAARRRVLLAIHWVVLGMLYCLSIFPLFGRPKSGPPETVTDFSQHVEAVGALLEKTHDASYAKHQLDQYRSL